MNNWIDKLGWKFKKTEEEQEVKSGYVAPQNDSAAFTIGSGYVGQYSYHMNFDQSVTDLNTLILKYREISMHPEVNKAVNEIVNEAIDGTTNGSPVSVHLDDLEQPDSIKKKITEEFDKILELMKFNQESYEIFRKWFIDGRLHFQVVIDNQKSTEGIKELRYIPSLNIKKIREEKNELICNIPTVVGYEDYYLYSKDKAGVTNTFGGTSSGTTIRLTSDSIAYCDSGIVDDQRNIVYGELQKAIRSANQLRMVEDAVIIYRLARAPERRVFYVDVGNLPKGKAEEFLRDLQNRYKNKMVYDGNTGEVKDSTNTLSMLEDFWMPRREGGKGTEVTTLPGGQNLGEIQDITYFKRKLFESMSVPLGRLTGDTSPTMGLGRSNEITREEVQFGAYIERLRKRFSIIFYEILKRQLILKKIISPQEWKQISSKISFDFSQNTFFAELKEIEIMKERISAVQLVDPSPIVGKYLSKEYVMREFLKFDELKSKKMEEQIDKEKKESEPLDLNPSEIEGKSTTQDIDKVDKE